MPSRTRWDRNYLKLAGLVFKPLEGRKEGVASRLAWEEKRSRLTLHCEWKERGRQLQAESLWPRAIRFGCPWKSGRCKKKK